MIKGNYNKKIQYLLTNIKGEIDRNTLISKTLSYLIYINGQVKWTGSEETMTLMTH